ncbi:MAG: hypothetical protein MI742_09355 [Desulfobacterales bacterium]|nr:hypothetical protein [Desulfobacterales bacterium]
MRVRYFPYTRLSEPMASQVTEIFEEVTLITTSLDTPLPNGVCGVAPPSDEAQRQDELLAGWRQYSGLHGAGVTTYALGGCRHFDPLNEQLTTQIKSELLRQVEGESSTEPDRPMAARVFLALAEELDVQSQELRAELEKIEGAEQGLFDALKGEIDPPGSTFIKEGAEADDVGMAKRLSAWSALFVNEPGAFEDRVFATHSREAFELVEEFCGGLKLLGRYHGIRLDTSALSSLLEGCPLVEDGEAAVCARIYIAEGEHPFKVFHKFADTFSSDGGGSGFQPIETKSNFIVVLLEGIACA